MVLDNMAKDFNNLSSTQKPKFEIVGFRRTPDLDTMKLIKSYGLSNMVLMNEQQRPVKYANVTRVLSAFYNARLEYYGKRKEIMLRNLKHDIQQKQYKILYIEAVAVHQTLEIRKRPRAEIVAQMKEMGIPEEALDNTTTSKLTLEEIEKLRREIKNAEEQFAILEKTSKNQLWKNDINEFLDMMKKYYPEWC